MIVAAFLMDYHLLRLHNLIGLDDNAVVTLALNLGMSFMCEACITQPSLAHCDTLLLGVALSLYTWASKPS